METRRTQTYARQTDFNSSLRHEKPDEQTNQRLDTLLKINEETAREKALFGSEQEKIEATLMKDGLNTKQAFAYFGLLLGTFVPAAMFTRFLIDARGLRVEDLWILGIVAIVNIITAVVGYFSGKIIARSVSEVEGFSWGMMLLITPFIGLVWGIMAGGAGGIIIFFVGAFFGAFLGGAVGSVALPAFALLHRLMKKGDLIDMRHFLPIAFGITFVICGFILGI